MAGHSSSPRLTLPSWSFRKVISATLVVVGVVTAFWLLISQRLVIFSLFEAIVISTAISPAVDWLQRRGLPRAAGVGVVYLISLAALVAVGLLIVPLVAEQGANISATFGTFYLSLLNTLRLSPSLLIRRFAWQFPGDVTPPAPAGNGTEADAAALENVTQLFAVLGLVGESLLVLVAVLLLAFYWTLDRERILRTLLLVFPRDRREGLREFVVAVEYKVGAYIRGTAVLSLVVAALAFVAYLLLGLPNALVLAILAGLFEVVPVVGPFLGALPAVLSTLANDPSKTIGVLIAFSAIQLVENTVLVPRIMGRAIGVSPAVTLLALLAFGGVFGLPGALLAIPLAAIIQLLLDRFVLGPSAVEPETPDRRDHLSLLRYEAQELIRDVRKQLRAKPADQTDDPDELEDAVEALATDLDALLARRSSEKDGEA